MAFKQPRVPEYRDGMGMNRYLKDLTLFLKDFCLNSWKETTNIKKGGNFDVEKLDEQLEKLRLDREHPVGGAPYLTLLPQDKDDPNVKWPWSKWTLDTSGRFFLGASDAHPLGETGGSETHKLTEEELPYMTGTISLGSGQGGVSAGGFGGVRSASGVFRGGIEMQYGRPTAATAQAYQTGTASYRDAILTIGSGHAHSNMPPYMTINIWIRTA